MSKQKSVYRCSACDKIRDNADGGYVEWDEAKSESVKICISCNNTKKLFGIQTVKKLIAILD